MYFNNILDQIAGFLFPQGFIQRDADQKGGDGRLVFLSGPDLIERIVGAISVGQSVLLSGPRGCGKSHCVREAIKEAERRGILTPGSTIESQGNREVPRDYLLEDDVSFEVGKGEDDVMRVEPRIRSAPLFMHAERDPATNLPTQSSVVCRLLHREQVGNSIREIEEPISRFAVFLDEINRFSDGVLDGLLSILEERKAYLRGKGYRLPVVVCMTMNPPGYDATARALSPPLAARIGRCYQLYSPDMSTLTSLIIKDKLEEFRKSRDTGSKVSVPDLYIQRVALVTLLLWGTPDPNKPSTEYLTKPTRELLEGCIELRSQEGDSTFRNAMNSLKGLIRFGPDGRAASDWLLAAMIFSQQRNRGDLDGSALDETAIESLSHKIYDNFSAAAEPHLVSRKENAITVIVKSVMAGQFDTLFGGIPVQGGVQ